MARRSKKEVDLEKVVVEYLNRLKVQISITNPTFIFFLEGLMKWISDNWDWERVKRAKVNFHPKLGSILTNLIREGKLELYITPEHRIHFGQSSH
ncbi:MAG TPA: hypothetical protein ENI19_01500 [Candidatus Nealsonbacteria bacterium]|uniref:Uncharacterized protein n=1 Tax=marine sediment metagenome TaxID=412755 RepID=A0A0F9X424_9ZZZZ|nr:hypothetical protein [Candidatus Nealsonbacteria bacterium]HEB46368.1 hypothetical protein [Candidatus Nealsonbacteria bacterium]